MNNSRIIIVVAIILLVGCSSIQQAEIVKMPPALLDVAIPPLTDVYQPHSASVPYDYITLGRDALLRSAYSEIAGESMRMEPAGVGFAWTIYELGTASNIPLQLTAELEVGSGEVYLGLSDFSIDAWRFLDPLSATGAHEATLSPLNVSPDDHVYLVLVSTPDSLVTISRVVLTVDQPGWLIYTLDDSFHAGWDLMMFTQDSKPMIAYGPPNDGVIHFLRAETSFPTEPGQWTSMYADTDLAPLGGPLAAASVDGRPAVAYVQTEEDLVMYAYSNVAEPSSVHDWESMVVYDAAGVGVQLGLVDYGSKPCLAFSSEYPKLHFAQAASSTPVADDWEVTDVVADEDAGYDPSVSIAGGRPAIFCHGEFDGIKGAYYLRATTMSPSGPADWNCYLAFDYPLAGSYNTLSMMPVKPSSYRPLASFLDDFLGGELIVNVAQIPIPLEPADWNINYLEDDILDNVVITTGGKPFVLYANTMEWTIKCAWSREDAPTGSEDWDFHVLAEGTTGDVAAVSISNTPIIAYRDHTNDVLRFGFYDE